MAVSGHPGVTVPDGGASDNGAPPGPVDFSVTTLPHLESFGDVMKFAPFEGITEKTLKSAISGMFVDIESFLKCSFSVLDNLTDLHPVMDTATGIVSYRCKKQQREVNDVFTWIEGFTNYQRVMVAAHGSGISQIMSEYIQYIMECDRKYHWPCVYTFDIRHRETISGRHINFMNYDPSLVVRMLDPHAVKPAKCLCCKSSAHATGECPLAVKQDTGHPPVPVNARHRSRSRGKSNKSHYKGICKNFNTSTCAYANCNREHTCFGCGGELPFRECSLKGPCTKPAANNNKPNQPKSQ